MVSTRSSSRPGDTPTSLSDTPRRTPSTTRNGGTRKSAAGGWQHVPSFYTRLWLAISLPLVVWDTIYVLGRPLTMEGGWMHWPFWVPYRLYGEVDYVYGWHAFKAKSGFTSAQGLLNVFETVMYMWYLWKVYEQGSWTVSGRAGGQAALIGFSSAVMTLSKTVLYCTFLIECAKLTSFLFGSLADSFGR